MSYSKFRERRVALGFTLRDVEEITGGEISNGYLSQFENGKIKNPSAHVILCLCAAYAVDHATALSWLQIPVNITPPRLCGECGQALPLKHVIDPAPKPTTPERAMVLKEAAQVAEAEANRLRADLPTARQMPNRISMEYSLGGRVDTAIDIARAIRALSASPVVGPDSVAAAADVL